MAKCPGQDDRFITAEEILCPSCESPVEFFSDEQKRRCPTCGTRVTRVVAPSCVLWCPSAGECVGAERYERLLKDGALEDAGTMPAAERDDDSSS
jgi:predicted amidophosphoribosyltransferase